MAAARTPVRFRPRLRSMGKYLHPREHVVTQIRHHGIVLTKPVLIWVLATVLWLWVDASVPATDDGTLPRLAFAVVVATFGWLLWQVFEWRHTLFVVTNKRIMLFHGWVTRRVSMMPLQKVTDMSYQLTIPGRLLRYGHFDLESAGQDQAFNRISFVPEPDEHYREIIGQIFGLEPAAGSQAPTGTKGSGRAGRHEDDEVPDEEDELDADLAEEDEPDHGDDGRRREPVGTRGRPRARGGDEYGPHVLGSSHDPRDASIYRSPDLVRRDRRRRGEVADTGELPPYDPDWRP